MHSGNQLSRPTQIGPSNGKRVLCSQQALPIFNNLLSLAKSGNYWAGLVVRGIQGLNSGRLSRDNIFVEQKTSLAYGKGAFHIVLPGVTASLEELPDGAYILQRIKTDGNYEAMQKDSVRPGLWRTSVEKEAKPEFQVNGQILNKEYRPVVIADRVTGDAFKTAGALRESIAKTKGMINNLAKIQGFDMHYTPGDSDIVGLKPAHKALSTNNEKEITQSAILLANTMYQARNIEGVLWYSDWGGSAVLTRAMEILHHEKSISLENHMIFMNRPTSKANYAIELAGKLGITPDAKGKNVWGHPKELKGNILVSLGADKETGGSLLKTTAFGVGTVSAGYAVATASLTAPGVVGIAGAMFFVGSAVKLGMKSLSGKKY